MERNHESEEANNSNLPPVDWRQEWRRRMNELIERKEWLIAYLEELFQVGVEQGPNGEEPARTA